MLNYKITTVLCVIGVFFIGCEKDTVSNVEPVNEITGRSSWIIIQQEILDKNCAGCHSVGTSFCNQ